MEVDQPANQPAAYPVADAELSFATYTVELLDNQGVIYAVENPKLHGSGDLPRPDLECIRLSFSLLGNLARAYSSLLEYATDDRMALFMDHAKLCMSSPDDDAVVSENMTRPVLIPGKTVHMVANEVETLAYYTCDAEWGPTDLAVRNCLSPAALAFFAWLSIDYSRHMLILLYLFCNDSAQWNTACMASPVSASALRLAAIPGHTKRYLELERPVTAAAAVLALCRKVLPVLKRAIHAVYSATTAFPEIDRDAVYREAISFPTVGAILSCDAHGFVATHSPASTTTMAVLPTSSSLPVYRPNFVRDERINWVRTAEHKFKHVAFPSDAITRGDVNSELLFHRYCCQVLHNRTLCMELSEQQVVEHLLVELKHYDSQYTIAEAKFKEPDCTVRSWLDAIRSAFFTSGQFRLNIEGAWHHYKMGQCRDFNDLMHHVRTYYQLIFLDYHNLPGKMTLHDFAWHLFEKLMHMTTAGASSLASVCRLSFPNMICLRKCRPT